MHNLTHLQRLECERIDLMLQELSLSEQAKAGTLSPQAHAECLVLNQQSLEIIEEQRSALLN